MNLHETNQLFQKRCAENVKIKKRNVYRLCSTSILGIYFFKFDFTRGSYCSLVSVYGGRLRVPGWKAIVCVNMNGLQKYDSQLPEISNIHKSGLSLVYGLLWDINMKNELEPLTSQLEDMRALMNKSLSQTCYILTSHCNICQPQ